MAFLLGCNYWASNAGADMWKEWDEKTVREDIKLLASYGISTIRIFPNWRDFQPVMPLYGAGSHLHGYCLEGEVPAQNKYYLDEKMMQRFSTLLDICEEYDIHTVVGIVTGWMSGRVYVPSALYGKNIISDPEALYFEQLFIKGFVSKFKSRKAIYAWDLGNECNCMAKTDRMGAVTWTAAISNAIRAADPVHPIVSGMHSLEINGTWQISDQAEFTDILTTHPYPYWCKFTKIDETLSIRTTSHATAESKYYSECSGKPCMAEEIGTVGPMLSCNDAAADFMRLNFFSLWANGVAGAMWWCAHDQTELTAFPYDTCMVERELGLLTNDRKAKPVLREIKKFADFLKSDAPDLPSAATDAVCLLSRGQRQWGVAYMSHILAKQAGMNLRFAYADNDIPDSKLYLVPSVNGDVVMNSSRYKELRKKVADGAILYISMDNGVFSEFESLTGVRVIDSYEFPEKVSFTFNEKKYTSRTKRRFILEATNANVLARDDDGNIMISSHKYGEGTVIYLNFPLEDALIETHHAFDSNISEIYTALLKQYCSSPISVQGDGVFATYHFDSDKAYAVAINHKGKDVKAEIKCNGYTVKRMIYGDINSIKPYDAAIIEFERSPI